MCIERHNKQHITSLVTRDINLYFLPAVRGQSSCQPASSNLLISPQECLSACREIWEYQIYTQMGGGQMGTGTWLANMI